MAIKQQNGRKMSLGVKNKIPVLIFHFVPEMKINVISSYPNSGVKFLAIC